MNPRRLLITFVIAIALSGLTAAAVAAATVTDGDLETGNFSGWTATDDGGGYGSWGVSATGTSQCGGTTNAPDGSDAALWTWSIPRGGSSPTT